MVRNDRYANTKNTDSLIFAENISRPMDISRTRLNNNVMVVGATGSGKTTSYTEANLLGFGEHSVVASLSKRRVADAYASDFRRRGYDVVTIDLADPHLGRCGYDPLSLAETPEDVADLARVIVDSTAVHEADPYWSNAAGVLLEALLHASVEMRMIDTSLGPATIADALALFDELTFSDSKNDGSTSTLDRLFTALELEVPDSNAVTAWRSVRGLAYRTVSCVHSTLAVALSKMFPMSIRDVAASEALFDPAQLGLKKTALFIITSPVNAAAHAFCQLLYRDVFRRLFELAERSPGYSTPVPVHVICDDFACGAKIEGFPEMISCMRAAGISASLLVQSKQQLSAMYGADGAQIIADNCDTMVAIGASNNLETARELSIRLNAPLSDVLRMRPDRAVVLQRGYAPVVANVYPTYSDERHNEMFFESAPNVPLI